MKNIEERNEDMQARGLADYTKAFAISFRDRKRVFFTVYYGDLVFPGQDAYFSTTAQELNHPRSDSKRTGQAQHDLIEHPKLWAFFEKWDVKHLKALTNEEYEELTQDLEALKKDVPYINSKSFRDIVQFDRELSK